MSVFYFIITNQKYNTGQKKITWFKSLDNDIWVVYRKFTKLYHILANLNFSKLDRRLEIHANFSQLLPFVFVLFVISGIPLPTSIFVIIKAYITQQLAIYFTNTDGGEPGSSVYLKDDIIFDTVIAWYLKAQLVLRLKKILSSKQNHNRCIITSLKIIHCTVLSS